MHYSPEVIEIKLNTRSKEKEVSDFLIELKQILCSTDFDLGKSFVLIRTKKEKGDEKFSTDYTMNDLEYDVEDVVERLKELSVEEYSETLIDKDNTDPPLLFVFGKDLNGRQIYIKLKIKGEQNRRVLCVSFHYAKEKMYFPYA